MQEIKLFLWLILFLGITSCTRKNEKDIGETKLNDLSLLIDSVNIFGNVEEVNIQGQLQGTKAEIKFNSVSKDDFFVALKANKENVRHFSRTIKFNENVDCNIGNRNETTLKVGDKENFIYLVDLKENKKHYARNFFLENRVGHYYVVKRIQFEDAETILWNSKTGEVDVFIFGTSVCTNSRDSLLFYSSTFMVTPEDVNPICLMKVKPDRIDTLLHVDTEWFTNFSFFHNKDSSIYYIHNYYEDYKLKSTFAKIDLKIH